MQFKFWPFRRKAIGPNDILAAIINGEKSGSGKSVSTSSALKVATVFACVRVIAEGVAQVPFKLFREEGLNRLPAKDHPLYDLLHRKPNANATSFQWRETLAMNAALAGEGFCFINRAQGKILELINLDPAHVTVEWPDRMGDRPTYTVTGKSGSKQPFPAEAILHVRGPCWGKGAIEPVRIAREAIGLSMAMEESTAKLHSNGVKSGGLLSVEGSLTGEQYKQLRKWIDEEHAGSSNAYNTMILDRGAKFTQLAMSAVDAQQIETRRFQIEEVCRVFRVMPIMVCSSDKATTYASAEQMFLAHVVHTLAPWYERIEQAIDCQLLTDEERAQGYYVKHVTQGLLRGALKDTAEYLYRLVNIGIMSRNEARNLLEMNPLDGLDEPLTPANMGIGEQNNA
jgi:HK97 family phage portal protein